MQTLFVSTEKLSPARRVTQAIESALARGVRPWARPWRDANCQALVLPRRANGHFYRGVNVIALWAVAAERGYCSPYWFTFNQALALGGQVRKGERGAFIVFYKAPEAAGETRETGDDGEARRRILRGYSVFNHEQIDGLADPRFDLPAPIAPLATDALARRFANTGADIRLGGTLAYYTPVDDYIQLPPMGAFPNQTLFYATLAHELGHWTGHPSRLNREYGARRFGDYGYALEELTAEMCAAFLGAVLGLPSDHIEDHAAYINMWLKVIGDNPSAFLSAAAQAQLAADYILHLMGEAPASQPAEI